jgi:hypothetical protein
VTAAAPTRTIYATRPLLEAGDLNRACSKVNIARRLARHSRRVGTVFARPILRREIVGDREVGTEMAITPAQVRAGRLLIGWSQLKLASETGVSAATIAIFEDGERQPPMLDMAVVERMLNDGGVEFIDKTPGVRMKTPRPSAADAVARQGAPAAAKSVGRG